MIKYFVYDESSEISSSLFDSYEEALNELNSENEHYYSLDAKILEVND